VHQARVFYFLFCISHSMYRDLICLLAIAFFTGESDRITPKTAAMARGSTTSYYQKSDFAAYPVQSPSLQFCVAELRGVITRFFRSFIVIAFFGQFFRHIHIQTDVFIYSGFFPLGFVRIAGVYRPIASTGQHRYTLRMPVH